MKRVKPVVRGAGKVILGLLGAILMPILIWVALGVAVFERLRAKRVQREPAPTIGEVLAAAGLSIQGETTTGKAVAARVFRRQPVPEISKVLAKAGMTLHEEAAPKPSWQIRVTQLARGAGKVILALLGAVLMPILIWIALGVAMFERMRAKRVQREPAPTIGEVLAAAGLSLQGETTTGKAVAARVFIRQPVPEISKVLAKAGMTLHEEAAPKHCWEILHCPPEKREACPAYARREIPCWVAIGLGKGGRISEVCVNCTLLDLKTSPLQG